MTALALAAALAGPPQASPPGSWSQTGRLLDTPAVHLGLRPAVFLSPSETDLGLTVQVSTRWL